MDTPRPRRAWLAAKAILWIGFPLAGQTSQPVWTVQNTRQVTKITGDVASAVSPDGEVYIAGRSNWYNWPAPTSTIGNVSNDQVLVSKLDALGRPIYVTAIGGASTEILMLDGSGGLYIRGIAVVGEFGTTPGSYRVTNSTSNSGNYVCKLRASDGAVLFCALFGPDGPGPVTAFTVDSTGSIYFTGPATPLGIPTPGAFTFGAQEIEVTKVDATASTVLWRGQFSGSDGGIAYISGIATDGQGNVWIGGNVSERDFPTTPDALFPEYPQSSGPLDFGAGFLAKLSASGSSLLYATYTSQLEELTSMSLDASGNIYAFSLRNNVPFVTKFDAAAKAVVYDRALPGPGLVVVNVAVDDSGFVTVLGSTQNVNLATSRSVQECSFTGAPAGSSDEVLVRVGPDGELLESTFLGLGDLVSFQAPLLLAQTSKGYVIAWSNPIPNSSPDIVQLELLQLGPDASAGDGVKLACLGSAATLKGSPLVAGEIVSLFGTGLGPQSSAIGQPGTDNRFPNLLSGTQVTFDGVPAPLLYTSDTQINAIVPWTLTGSATTKVCVFFQSVATNCIMASLAGAAPGIFQLASGYAAVINQDGTINSPDNPAHSGSTVYLYATGFGPVSPLPVDGSVVPLAVPTQTDPVEVIFAAGQGSSQQHATGEVLHTGPAPLEVAGLFQVDLKISTPVTIPLSGQPWNVTIVVDLPDNSRVFSPALPIALAP